MSFKERDFYKLVNSRGMDCYTSTFDYVDCIGHHVEMNTNPKDRPKKPSVCTDEVMHASATLSDALRSVGRRRSPLRVLVIHGTPVCRSPKGMKHGFYEFVVVREITDHEEMIGILLKENEDRTVVKYYYNGRGFVTDPMQRPEAEKIVKDRIEGGFLYVASLNVQRLMEKRVKS